MISRVNTKGLIRINIPTLPPVTNSPELCMLDVCNKTNLCHRALVRSDQLMFSGHFWDLKEKRHHMVLSFTTPAAPGCESFTLKI